MDALGANIQVDARGAEIKRVLPLVNEEVNQEWVSDKGRFSYDGLKKQRLTMPLLRQEDGSYQELTWMEALNIAAGKFNELKGEQM